MRLAAAAPRNDEKKFERLTAQLGLTECAKQADEIANPPDPRPSSAELARCGARGNPVTLAELVKVFRANRVTLDIDESACLETSSEPGGAGDATNAGPSGLETNEAIKRVEEHVLCTAYTSGSNRQVVVNKFVNDVVTHVGALNVGCSVYPSDGTAEEAQVERVRKAFAALVRQSP